MKIELRSFRQLSILIVLMMMSFGYTNAQTKKNSFVPIVDLGPDGYICDGTPRLLNAYNVGCTYEWKFNDSLVSDSSFYLAYLNGTYSVKVIALDSTAAFDTIKLKLVNNPAFHIIVENKINNHTAQFSVAPFLIGCSYLWDFNDPASSSNISMLASPTHTFVSIPNIITLEVTDVMTSCSKVDTLNDVEVIFESVSYTNASFFNVNIFPNPITSESKLLFTVKNPTSIVTLKAYDLLGREQFIFFENEKVLQGENSIDLSSYFQKSESTISFLKLTIDDNIISSKIINLR